MKKHSRTKNSILNFFTGLGGQLILTVMSFVVRTVFIRTLGKSYLGINGLFANILQMLSLTELGLATAMNFKLYQPLAQHDERRVRILMKFYRDAYRAVGATIMLLGFCVIPFLPVLINDYDTLKPLGINATLIFSMYLFNSVSSYLFFASRSAIVKADQREYLLNIIDYFILLFKAIVEIIVLLVFRSFILYTGIAVFTSILKNFINAVIAKKNYPYAFEKESDKLSRAEVKDTFKDLGALFLYKVNNVVVKATDNMVLSSFIGLAIVGAYSNYVIIYSTIRTFLMRIFSSTRASAGNLFAKNDMGKKYEYFRTLSFVSAVFFGTACVGIAVVADELIGAWLGTEYVLAQPFSVLMGIEIYLVGIVNSLGQIRGVTGAFRQGWWRPLMCIATNLTVSILLVQKLGIVGVLLGTIASDVLVYYFFEPFIIYKYSFQYFKPISDYFITNTIYMAVVAAVGAADWVICTHFATGFGWLSVFVHIIICGLSVPAVFLLIYHNHFECRYLLKKAASILGTVKKKVFGKKKLG